MKLFHTYLITLSLLISPIIGYSQMQTKYVTIFKNGTAFIQKSGTVKKRKKGTYKWSENLPEAIYGTFWFSSPTGKIVSVKSKS